MLLNFRHVWSFCDNILTSVFYLFDVVVCTMYVSLEGLARHLVPAVMKLMPRDQNYDLKGFVCTMLRKNMRA